MQKIESIRLKSGRNRPFDWAAGLVSPPSRVLKTI